MYVAAFLAVILMWVALGAAAIIGQEWKQDRLNVQSLDECQEDMPCWDCTSMGNGRCGP